MYVYSCIWMVTFYREDVVGVSDSIAFESSFILFLFFFRIETLMHRNKMLNQNRYTSICTYIHIHILCTALLFCVAFPFKFGSYKIYNNNVVVL